MMEATLQSVTELLERYRTAGLKIAVAESLTGGEISAALTAPAGASQVVLGSLVVYQSELKHELAGVSSSLLEQQGAVDPEVAAQLAAGCRQRFARSMSLDPNAVVAISATGVAGPDPQDGKAVGTVFIGLSGFFAGEERTAVYPFLLEGSRASIRQQTVVRALEALAEQLN